MVTVAKYYCVALLLLAVVCSASPAAYGYESEDVLKVSIIAKLAKFVHGNGDADPTFTIAILNNPFGELPDKLLTDKRIHHHPVVVQHIDSLQKLGNAQVLFIPKMPPEKMHALLTLMQNKNILTISDSRGFAQLGGMI